SLCNGLSQRMVILSAFDSVSASAYVRHSPRGVMAIKIDRREALGLLGGGMGAGFTLALRSAHRLRAQSPGPNGAVIRTLLKDLPPTALAGPTLFHEHLSIRYPLTKTLAEQQGRPVPPSFTDDVDLMVEETKAAGKESISCIVDGGHPDMDRDLAALKRIA